jgi:hypothetical protein
LAAKWKRDSNLPKNHPPVPKSPYSDPFSEAVKIYTLGDLKVKRRGNQAIHPRVVTNGYEEFAKNQKSNVLNADIGDFFL